jgi:DNA-binding XRE family transcriptional regulator
MTDVNPDSGSGGGTLGIATAAELASVREARGWTIQDAAQRMRLAARQIEAMEKGHWNELPGWDLHSWCTAGLWAYVGSGC